MDVPIPKLVTINKCAVDLVEFDAARDDWRSRGQEVLNLDRPADAVDFSNNDFATGDFPAFAYTGYRRTQKKTGPRKRHRDYTCKDFVDTSKAVVGSSEESDKRGMERDSHSRIEVHDEDDDDHFKLPATHNPARYAHKKLRL